MKPYGNEHKFYGDGLNSTRRVGKVHGGSKCKRAVRRINKKKRRQQDKRLVAKGTQAST